MNLSPLLLNFITEFLEKSSTLRIWKHIWIKFECVRSVDVMDAPNGGEGLEDQLGPLKLSLTPKRWGVYSLNTSSSGQRPHHPSASALSSPPPGDSFPLHHLESWANPGPWVFRTCQRWAKTICKCITSRQGKSRGTEGSTNIMSVEKFKKESSKPLVELLQFQQSSQQVHRQAIKQASLHRRGFNRTLTSGSRVFLKHTLERPSLVRPSSVNAYFKTVRKWKCKSLSCVRFFVILWTAAHQAPLHGVSQARILEWVAIPFFRGYSQPRNQNWASCTAGRFFTNWATREQCNTRPNILLTIREVSWF